VGVVGIAGDATGSVGLAHQVAEGVVVETRDPAQGVGGGQPAVQPADLVGGDVPQRILLADELVVLVEPMGGATAGGIER